MEKPEKSEELIAVFDSNIKIYKTAAIKSK